VRPTALPVLVFHRLLLRTARTPLRRAWLLAYRALARVESAYLTWGVRGATTYLRGGSSDDLVPGLSDIDLTVVVPAGRAGQAARVVRRWRLLYRHLRPSVLLFDWPRVYDDVELPELSGPTVFTYGLDEPVRRSAVLVGPEIDGDVLRTLERPGIHGLTDGWKHLSGPRRQLPAPARGLDPVALWLELTHWWRWTFPVCAGEGGPRTAHLCVKLASEPAAIWLALAHGERPAGREETLLRARRLLPEEDAAFERALWLWRSLDRVAELPLAESLALLVRMSQRIAAAIEERVAGGGATPVALAGDPRALVLAHGRWRPPPGILGEARAPMPLVDPRSLLLPRNPDEAFVALPGDADDPEQVGAAARAKPSGPRPLMRAGSVFVLPAVDRSATRMRAVHCRLTDPVSFALLAGETHAAFPNVRGWSASDVARRAVAEHGAGIRNAPDDDGRTLGLLLSAVRAALFHAAVLAGDPRLAVTVAQAVGEWADAEPAARGAAEDALAHYRVHATTRVAPPPATVAALRDLVLALPAYRV
jgi:hypothetical protein